ncbi:MAG: HAMP domain-containing histidine kinase [Verrucomicrobia bacterium]|nr:HAMP domain-containing histidine kinase [Verrucomicrobiota bacterium]
MKVTYPLSLKVSVWLLLNLLLLAALSIGFFVVQGGLGWDALVAGPGGDRAQATANIVAGEAAAATAEKRQEVLARFGAAYGVEFFLLRMNDPPAAAPAALLPAEVRARIEFRPPWIGSGGFGARGEGGSLRGKEGLARGDSRRLQSGEIDASSGRDVNEKGRRQPPDLGRGGPPFDPIRERGRFVVRAGSPVSYWVGVRVPFAAPERGRFQPPAMLVARVGSLWSLLHFLDHQSWLLAGTGVLVLSILFWLPLLSGITRALAQLTAATERIADGRFDTRVPATRRDELGKLGESVNRMAGRLDAHMSGQKRFLGDVAHELCSPLARLQMATGILADRAPAGLRETVADVRDEVQQMSTLVNQLLAFTKAGLQRRDVALTRIQLMPLVRDVLARETATERVTLDIPSDLHGLAEVELLSRALANLVRNAVRYAGEAAPIVVSGRREGARVIIAVDDDGPGVPAEALDRLGEPFFRPEAARTRELGGVGLGLAIVRSSIAACGGEVRFANRTPRGFRAELLFAAA